MTRDPITRSSLDEALGSMLSGSQSAGRPAPAHPQARGAKGEQERSSRVEWEPDPRPSSSAEPTHDVAVRLSRSHVRFLDGIAYELSGRGTEMRRISRSELLRALIERMQADGELRGTIIDKVMS